MKRPAKVTRETRLNQYARKMYGKEKEESLLEEEERRKGGENLSAKRGAKKKIRKALNKKLRHADRLPSGGAYRKAAPWEDEK